MNDPQALHAALLAEANKAYHIWTPKPAAVALAQREAAVRAVLELHEPKPCDWDRCGSPDVHRLCSGCGRSTNYPCGTVKVIASELGVVFDG